MYCCYIYKRLKQLRKGLEAGLHLASVLIHLSPQIVLGSRAAAQLGRGMTEALKVVTRDAKAYGSEHVMAKHAQDVVKYGAAHGLKMF